MDQVSSNKTTHCLLMDFIMRSKQRWNKIAEKYGLTVQQLHTLNLLSPGTSTKMNGLCGQLHCDASNVTGIVERLVAHDLVTRRESPDDRRVKMIALTEKGEAVRNECMGGVSDSDGDALASLTPQELAELHRLLAKISD